LVLREKALLVYLCICDLWRNDVVVQARAMFNGRLVGIWMRLRTDNLQCPVVCAGVIDGVFTRRKRAMEDADAWSAMGRER